MCGFIASFGLDYKVSDFKNALNHLSRRGPDSEGIWNSEKVFMGSRRLSIFDLKDRSNQPMISLCSRYIIIFNGAIYNYKNLREYLLKKNINLKTESDTEVILELYALEGTNMIDKLQGMFAFVIWDKIKKEAFAARDPYGIKPVYIGTGKDGLILSSQVKTLLLTKFINKDTDLHSKFSYYKLGYVLEPRTWYKNIKALKPGNFILIKNGKLVTEKEWYDLGRNWEIADKSKKLKLQNNYKDIIKKALIASVKRHLISDVPIGIFLSSGIDSTLIAAIASENSKKKITAITVSFDEFNNSEQNETVQAGKIAKKFGINHYIYKVSRDDFNKDFPKIIEAMDQPSIDGINIWYASKAAKKLKLKVVFSGVGGDELFYGYDHFKSIPILYNCLKFAKKFKILKILINVFFNILKNVKRDNRWKYLMKFSNSIFELWLIKRTIMSDIEIIKKYRNLDSVLNIFYNEAININKKYTYKNHKINLSQIESMYYLKNQLLKDSDWASMYHGVELRTPFVDATLLEDLKEVMAKYSFDKNKISIISSFKSILPKNVKFDRKIGFQTPIQKWLKKDFISKNYEKNRDLYNFMKIVTDSIKN